MDGLGWKMAQEAIKKIPRYKGKKLCFRTGRRLSPAESRDLPLAGTCIKCRKGIEAVTCTDIFVYWEDLRRAEGPNTQRYLYMLLFFMLFFFFYAYH